MQSTLYKEYTEYTPKYMYLARKLREWGGGRGESENLLLVESGILGFGIQNTAQGSRNPSKDWNPESKFY